MRVLLDNRLGNTPKYYFGEKENDLMLVPDEIRKCVVFVSYKSKGVMVLAGTAFFVSVPGSNPNIMYPYLVTARHVIEGIKKNSIDGKVYIRVNLKDKPSINISSELTEWKCHPTLQNVDVAVFNAVPDMDTVDFRTIPLSMAATPDVIAKENIGCGDEVFLTGLFSNHYGQQRNIPIIRIGNIACMPEEAVQTKALGAIDAYLIEARSIGGLSGSPVFVQTGGIRRNVIKTGGLSFYLLGLMHGHFDLMTQGIDNVLQDNYYALTINMGIAIVIPVDKILEVINQPELVEYRKQMDEAYRLRQAATPDSTSPNASEQPS